MNNFPITSLWVGKELNILARLSIKSFLDNGYDFHLYTYNHLDNIPTGCIVKDANKIIPSDELYYIYNIHHKSICNFSDLWRFTFLRDVGGIWTDLDNIILKPINFPIIYNNGCIGLIGYPKNHYIPIVMTKLADNPKLKDMSPINILKYKNELSKTEIRDNRLKSKWGNLNEYFIRNFSKLKTDFEYKYYVELWTKYLCLYDKSKTIEHIPENIFAVHMFNEVINCYSQGKIHSVEGSIFHYLMNKYLPGEYKTIL